MNQCIFTGRLTHGPELKTTTSGLSVTSFNIAVPRVGKEEQVDFIPVVCWRKTAEFAAKYFEKGMRVIIIGKLQTNEYTDNNNNKKRYYEIIADSVEFADSRHTANEDVQQPEAAVMANTTRAATQEHYSKPVPANSTEYTDNDLPF